MELRARMQRIVLAHRGNYGYRRVSRELKDQGLVVNHKRVLRLMQEDNLLAVRRRKFILTTDSRHDLPVYMNLAARMQLSGIDQLWVADITYIRLREAFVYLAMVLDAFSRRVVGWSGRMVARPMPILQGHRPAQAGARVGTSLRPRRSICFRRVCGALARTWPCGQHEPARQSL